MLVNKVVRPDAKGRITLGRLADGVSGYKLTEREDHTIILEPQVEIPAQEKWLYENKTAHRKVVQGLRDASEGKLINKGSFSKYTDDDAE